MVNTRHYRVTRGRVGEDAFVAYHQWREWKENNKMVWVSRLTFVSVTCESESCAKSFGFVLDES